MAKRTTLYRIQLTIPAKQLLQKKSETLGATQINLMSKVCEWFAQQPEEIRAAVLGIYPKSIEPNVAKLLLNRRKK